MKITPFLLFGCLVVFIMLFISLFVFDKLLNLSNVLEKACPQAETLLRTDKSQCELNLLTSKSISYLILIVVAASIGGTGYFMIKSFKGIPEREI